MISWLSPLCGVRSSGSLFLQGSGCSYLHWMYVLLPQASLHLIWMDLLMAAREPASHPGGQLCCTESWHKTQRKLPFVIYWKYLWGLRFFHKFDDLGKSRISSNMSSRNQQGPILINGTCNDCTARLFSHRHCFTWIKQRAGKRE